MQAHDASTRRAMKRVSSQASFVLSADRLYIAECAGIVISE